MSGNQYSNETGGATDPPARSSPSGAAASSSRRKFMVAGAASWASVSLAGCAGVLDDEDDDGGDEATPTFVVTDEVIAGSEGIPEGTGGFVRPGAPQRTFVPGMQAVFKVGVWDRESNAIVSDQALDSVIVELDRDESIDLNFYRDDREWSGDWMIPEEEEPGTVEYVVEVTNSAEFTHVGILESEIELIDFESPAANYVVTDDTYATEERGGGWVQSCLPAHNFTPDMAVGFDIGIYDGGSGEPVGPDVVDEAVIEFEEGDPDTMELEWDEEDEIWNETWRGIPEDYEGTLTYEVQVTNEDREFHHVGVYQGSIEIIEDPDAAD